MLLKITTNTSIMKQMVSRITANKNVALRTDNANSSASSSNVNVDLLPKFEHDY